MARMAQVGDRVVVTIDIPAPGGDGREGELGTIVEINDDGSVVVVLDCEGGLRSMWSPDRLAHAD